MSFLMGTLALLMGAWGVTIYLDAGSVAEQVPAFVLFVGAAVVMSGAAVVEAVGKLLWELRDPSTGGSLREQLAGQHVVLRQLLDAHHAFNALVKASQVQRERAAAIDARHNGAGDQPAGAEQRA